MVLLVLITAITQTSSKRKIITPYDIQKQHFLIYESAVLFLIKKIKKIMDENCLLIHPNYLGNISSYKTCGLNNFLLFD